jgi:lysophospholipase L1-like esterase
MSPIKRSFLVPAILLALSVAAVAEPLVLWPVPKAPAGTPVDVYPLPRYDWLANFAGRLDLAKKGGYDLVFDGDSITDFWLGRGKAVWDAHYVPLHAIDFGISGDRTEHLLWRLDRGQVDGLHPKLVVIMIGTNNMGANTAEEIAAGDKAIVAEYRKRLPDAHILLLGIFPRSEKATDPVRAKIAQVNQIISKLDDGKHVTYLDIGAKFLEPDGTLTREIMPDFLHPSEKGYQIWADAIQPVVDQYCPKSAASTATTPAPAESTPMETITWPLPPVPAGTPTTIFPAPRADWFGRFAGNLDKLKNGPYDLVFDGDSITDNWQGPGHDVLAQRFAGIKVLDIAIGGDQTQHVLWRLQHGDLEGQNPKLIMLMIGTNNGGRNPADIAACIKTIIGEYETRCPNAHILLLGVFPRGAEAKSGSREWIANINKILATYDDGKKVTFMDIGAKFLQPDGTLTKEIMPDFLHPSAAGYTIWADAIQPVIDQYFPKPAAK